MDQAILITDYSNNKTSQAIKKLKKKSLKYFYQHNCKKKWDVIN